MVYIQYMLLPQRAKPSRYISIYIPRKLLRRVREYIGRRYGDANTRALSLTVREALLFYLDAHEEQPKESDGQGASAVKSQEGSTKEHRA